MTSNADSGAVIATFKITGHGDHQMRGPVTIGRDPRSDDGSTVEVDGDPLVSKSHFSVDIDQGDLIITDLGSSNGTYLHHAAGETAVPSDRWIPIPDGAEIEFGDQRMTLQRAAPVEPTADSEVHPDEASTVEHEVPVARPVAATPGNFWAGDVDDAVADAAPIEDSVDCPECERELPAGSKFCDGCGTPIMPDEPASPVADDPGHTVVVGPGGFVPANPTPAARAPSAPAPPQAPPGGPSPHAGVPPHYGGVASAPPQGVAPQGSPPPGQYGQPPPPQGAQIAPPHQAGGPVFVDPYAASGSQGGTGKKILIGVGALAIVGLIGAGLVVVLGGGDDSTSSGRFPLPSVATEIDEVWSTDVEGESGVPGLGESAVYVASRADQDIVITSLARGDGAQNWDATIDEAESGSFVGEFGDVTVFEVCGFDADSACSVIGLDTEDGEDLWTVPTEDGTAFVSSGQLLVDDGDGLILLDPATGDRLERVRGEESFNDFVALLVGDDLEVTAFDDELQPVFGPVELDIEDASAGTFDGTRLLIGVGDEIDFVDAEGDVTPGPFLDGDITFLVALDENTLIAELGDEVVVYDIDDDDAVERWTVDGTFDLVAQPDGGTVVIVNAGSDRVIVDLESGEERFDVDADPGSVVIAAADNAFVVIDRGDDPDVFGDATVTAYDWETGDEIWSEDIDGAVVVDELVVEVGADGDVIAFG